MKIYIVTQRDYVQCNCGAGNYEDSNRAAFTSEEEAQAFIDSQKYHEYKYKGEIKRKPRADFYDWRWYIEEMEIES